MKREFAVYSSSVGDVLQVFYQRKAGNGLVEMHGIHDFGNKMMKRLVYLTMCMILVGGVVCSTPAFGADLKQALVRRVINNVYVYEDIEQRKPPRAARAGRDVLKGDMALRTGQDSRSELLFNDRSVARVGSNALFGFNAGTRELNVAQGVVMMQVEKGQRPTQIRTAAATAAVTGTTVMVEHNPGNHVKAVVLEGNMTVSLDGRVGESRTLNAGQMLLFPPNASRLPEPVDVDVGKLVSSSRLVSEFEEDEGDEGEESGGESGPDAGAGGDGGDESFEMGAIEESIQEQEQLKEEGVLQETNMVIEGEGTVVEIVEEPTIDETTTTDDTTQEEEQTQSTETQKQVNESTREQLPEASRQELEEAVQLEEGLPTISGSLTVGSNDFFDPTTAPPVLSAGGQTFDGALWDDPTEDGLPSAFLFGSTSTFDQQFGFDAFFLTAPGAGPFPAFAFEQLTLNGGGVGGSDPTLALISQQAMSVNGFPTGAENLLLGTVDGSIDVAVPAVDVPPDPNLFLYARGSGSDLNLHFPISTGSSPTLRNGAFIGWAQDQVNVLPSSSYALTGEAVMLRSGGPLTVQGSAAGDVGTVAAEDFMLLDGSGVSLQDAARLVTTDGGDIRVFSNGGNINAQGINSTETNRVLMLTCASGDVASCDPTNTISEGRLALNTMDPLNPGSGGNITLENVHLESDVLTLGAHGQNSSINLNSNVHLVGGPDGLVRIYAPGANGTIRFNENLLWPGEGFEGNRVQLIAPNVEIASGKTVEFANSGSTSVSLFQVWNSSGSADWTGSGSFFNPSILSSNIHQLGNPHVLNTNPSPDPFVLGSASYITLDPEAVGGIHADDGTNDAPGTVYRGAPMDGVPSRFFFASKSNRDLDGNGTVERDELTFAPLTLLDALTGFDQPGEGYEDFIGWQQAAAIKFNQLNIGDLNTGSLALSHLALIAENGINVDPTYGNDGGLFPSPAPNTVFLGTANGPITVNADLTGDFGLDPENNVDWMIYARGAGDGKGLGTSAGAGDLRILQSTDISDNRIDAIAGDVLTVQLPGGLSAHSVELGAQGSVELKGANLTGVNPNSLSEGGEVEVSSLGQISVTSSSQLLALTEAAAEKGYIEVQSFSGPILLQGSGPGKEVVFRACDTSDCVNPEGEILVEAGGGIGREFEDISSLSGSELISGIIQTRDVNMLAEQVKMAAYGPSGAIQIGSNTTLEASQLLRLYAPGSNGTIRFTGSAALNGFGAKDIAARTVEIVDGVNVQVNGQQANVYADVDNWGKAGFGDFTGVGATDAGSLDQAPDFDAAPPPPPQ